MGKNYTTNTAALKATTIDTRILSTSSKIEVGNVVKDGQGNITQGTKITPDGISTKALAIEKDGVRTDLVDFVKNSINALDSTNNGSHGISVVQTNGVVSTTVSIALVDADGTITSGENNVVTASASKNIADKAAADKIDTELTSTTGSISQAIETAKNDAINKTKVTVKTGTTSEAITELTLTDTSTSSDDVKIYITPLSNTAGDGKLNLKVSATTSTLAKKADTISAEGKNTTVATGTAPEVKVVLGGTVSSPTITVTAKDVASSSTLSALVKTVNDHIAAKGGAITIQLVDSLLSIENPSTEVIYLIPAADSKESNVKDEYIYVNGQFEKIGSTAVSLDGYATEKFVTDITDNKADADAVVSSINELKGDVIIKGLCGIVVGVNHESDNIMVAEVTINVNLEFFDTLSWYADDIENKEVVITDNKIIGIIDDPAFINTCKIKSIDNDYGVPVAFVIADVDLPLCETLRNVLVYGKVSCPKLNSEYSSGITLDSLEAMLYFVDSLPQASGPMEEAFTMHYSEALLDMSLFNELNAELKAKGWTLGVTLTDDLGQSVN